MSKRFTVKDFILYNSPCFVCGGENNFYIEIDVIDITPGYIGRVSKRALVTLDYTEVELVVHYAKNLSIKINHKTNKFTTNNFSDLVEYLKTNKLSMRLRCYGCLSEILTNTIEFNLEKLFVHPLELEYETFIIKDDNIYQVFSRFGSDRKTIVTIYKNVNKMHKSKTMILPIIPIYKFKTKEKFLNKMKTYLIFS